MSSPSSVSSPVGFFREGNGRCVGVAVGVCVGVRVGVAVGVLVAVGVGVGVLVAVGVGVLVAVAVGVRVGVFVAVGLRTVALAGDDHAPHSFAYFTPSPLARTRNSYVTPDLRFSTQRYVLVTDPVTSSHMELPDTR